MANKKETSYWPHMILGFLAIGITLGYWTVSSAINMPVSESNRFQKKYQQADMNINEIIEAQQRFDNKYTIEPVDFKISDFKPNKFLKRKHGDIISLSSENNFRYRVKTKDGQALKDADVAFLLTRPHTVEDDQRFEHIKSVDGTYAISNIKLDKAGRYTLRLRVQKGNAVGFMEHEAYLDPK